MIPSSAVHAAQHEIRRLSELALCACGRAVSPQSRGGRCETCEVRYQDLRHDLSRGYLDGPGEDC